jgi:hypothetical protein
MNQLEILIPFGLPPAQLAPDLLRELATPSLALLSARSRAERTEPEANAAFSRVLPHEAWLAQRFGLHREQDSSPPIAPLLMRALGLAAANGVWFVLQPVHIHIARDHLVLTDPRRLLLSEQESRTLFDIAQSLFREADMELAYSDPHTWFVRANQWSDLQTASPDAASGHNIDIWMPQGPQARAWRKIQNEVQMHWHAHPLNHEREARGLQAVNSIWLWGGARADATNTGKTYSHTYNLSGWMRAFNPYASTLAEAASAAAVIAARPESGLAILDALLAPALASDWASWLQQMRAFEANWFAPLQDAVKSGALDRLTLVFSDDSRIFRFIVTRASLRKFWVKPTLSTLLP